VGDVARPPDPSAPATINATAPIAAINPASASARRRRCGGVGGAAIVRMVAEAPPGPFGPSACAGLPLRRRGKTPDMGRADRLIEELRGAIADERVLAAIRAVPREAFVPSAVRARAYENVALPIGWEQTISQPLVVARMTELLRVQPQDRVLDVGSGSGYHAAVLARLAAHVWSVERHRELSEQAATHLRRAGVANVTLLVGDGSRGLSDTAPFDAINVAAAAWPEVPPALERQLAPGGRLVAPVGASGQQLVLVERGTDGGAGELTRTTLDPVRFVPLIEGEP
jgi:protein-L-isoaspartate(D-aspartate) O-methyltransferase